MRSTRNRWGAGYVWALAGTLLLTSCSDSTDQGTASNEAEELADVETTPLQKSLNDAKPGEVVVASENSYEGTLYIPDGVHFKGDGDDKFVIKPEDGLPGLILEGPGNSQITNVLVENAGGAGILITERSVKLQDVEVTGTKINSTDEGHGILVKNAPSFEAIAVSSTGNSGSGLRIEDSDNITVIHPQFIPIPKELIDGASRVVIHPQFIPQDEESRSVIHPQFSPSDDDGIAVIHPQFSENEEDYLIVIHPQFMKGASFSGNSGDGIAVIHPQFSPGTTNGTVNISGVTATENGGKGIHIEGVEFGTMSRVAVTENGFAGQTQKAGIESINSSLFLAETYISSNAGPGMLLTGSSLTTSNPDQKSPFTRNQEDGLTVIHPQFLPTVSIEENGQGGLIASQTNDSPILGKGDGVNGKGILLNDTLVSDNAVSGIDISCADLSINDTIIRKTLKAGIGMRGVGLMVDRDARCSEVPSIVTMNSGSLISENEDAGVRLRN